MDSCKLCGGKLDQCDSQSALDLLYRVECPRCGVYRISDLAISAEPEPFVKERLHLISAVARWSSERGKPLMIKEELLDSRSEFEARILSMCPRNTQEKMDSILAYIAERSYPGQEIEIDTKDDYPLFYCKEGEELRFYLQHLSDCLLVVYHGTLNGTGGLRLAAEGWRRVEEQGKPNIESKQAFVAMWFDEELKSAYSEGIAELEKELSGEGVMVVRDITREEAKKEIQQLFASGRTLYYSDIVKELQLDLETVVEICEELRGNKEIDIDARVSTAR